MLIAPNDATRDNASSIIRSRGHLQNYLIKIGAQQLFRSTQGSVAKYNHFMQKNVGENSGSCSLQCVLQDITTKQTSTSAALFEVKEGRRKNLS